MICGNSACGKDFTPKRRHGRFCSDTCRAAHRREGGMACTVKSVRALARGGFSIIVFSPTAPTLTPGSRCNLETE